MASIYYLKLGYINVVKYRAIKHEKHVATAAILHVIIGAIKTGKWPGKMESKVAAQTP